MIIKGARAGRATAGACVVAWLAGSACGTEVVRVGDAELVRSEFRASTFGYSAQEEASLALSHDGSITLVWSSRRQQEGRYAVYAQRFDGHGVALGSETRISLWNDSHALSPAIAVGPRGEARIAWLAYGQDGHTGGILSRWFDDRLHGGSEVLVNQEWRGHQSEPVVGVDRDGRTLIVWSSVESPKVAPRLLGRLFAADGAALTDEFPIGDGSGRLQSVPAVAFAADGSFAVAYAIADARNVPAGIRLAHFDADGAPAGDVEVRGGGAVEPVIEATPDGYAVAWHEAAPGEADYRVAARRMDRAGAGLGEAFVVTPPGEGTRNGAAIAVRADGAFAIAYNAPDGDGTGVFARLFGADGTPLGEEFRVTGVTEGMQALQAARATRRLVFTPEGALVCAWSGQSPGDKNGVHVTMLTPREIRLVDRVQGVTPDMAPAGAPGAGEALATPHVPPTFDPAQVEVGERTKVDDGRAFGFDAILNTGWTPPDPHLAVGPSHIVVMTNGAIAFFQKNGTKDFQDEIEDSFGFWGSVGATGFVFDPEVLYDPQSGRFFAMAAEAFAPGNRSYVLVAVSDDSNPNGTWYKYRFETTALAGDLFDSPNIGVSPDVVVITGDGFGISANYPVYTFDKASLLAGLPPAVTRSTTMSTTTQSAGLSPVTFADAPGVYFLEHQEGTSRTAVRVLMLQNPLTTPTFVSTTVTVPSYSAPEDPPQQGTTSRPETFDARFWSVAQRQGRLWGTHHVNNSRVRARWYEIDLRGWPVSGSTPTLLQSGEIDPGGTVRTFFSAIGVDGAGNAVITSARSSPTEFISMITAYRTACDPTGTFRAPVTEKSATAGYTSGRWGDYASVQPDPASPNTFWAHHEYAIGSSWRTWIARVDVDACPADWTCDGVVNSIDITAFLNDFNNSNPRADLNADGLFNSLDVLAYLNYFNTPC